MKLWIADIEDIGVVGVFTSPQKAQEAMANLGLIDASAWEVEEGGEFFFAFLDGVDGDGVEQHLICDIESCELDEPMGQFALRVIEALFIAY